MVTPIKEIKPFSWKTEKEEAIPRIQDYYLELARQGDGVGNPDLKLVHPDWVRDVNLETPNTTPLKTQVKTMVEKHQMEAIQRREKLLGQ